METIKQKAFSKAVDSAFKHHDTGKTGTVETSKSSMILNEAFKKMGHDTQLNHSETNMAMRGLDMNRDGRISKEELKTAAMAAYRARKTMKTTHH